MDRDAPDFRREALLNGYEQALTRSLHQHKVLDRGAEDLERSCDYRRAANPELGSGRKRLRVEGNAVKPERSSQSDLAQHCAVQPVCHEVIRNMWGLPSVGTVPVIPTVMPPAMMMPVHMGLC